MVHRGVHLKILISWQARVSGMTCRFHGAGGVGGGRSATPSSTPDPKVSSSCLLACLFGFVSAKQTKGKAKAKKIKENSCEKERKKERKTKDQRTKGLADQWTSGLQGTSGPGDQRTRGRTRGPATYTTGNSKGISSRNEYFLLIQ